MQSRLLFTGRFRNNSYKSFSSSVLVQETYRKKKIFDEFLWNNGIYYKRFFFFVKKNRHQTKERRG